MSAPAHDLRADHHVGGMDTAAHEIRIPQGNPRLSPLRYPGGKWQMTRAITAAAATIGPRPRLIVEPFAGSSIVSLSMLNADNAGAALIGDADPALSAFWTTAALWPEDLIACHLAEFPPTVQRWRRWKQDCPATVFDQARRALYLNRTSVNGNLHRRAGCIGGTAQKPWAEWIGEKYSLEQVPACIRQVGRWAGEGRLCVSAAGWWETVESIPARFPDIDPCDVLLYLDPPYEDKAGLLYATSFGPADHEDLAAYLTRECPYRWILSYDDRPTVHRLYAGAAGATITRPTHVYTGGRTRARQRQQQGRELLLTRPMPAAETTPTAA